MFHLKNAQFVADSYHLFDGSLEESFGKGAHVHLEHHLRLMVNAETESFFNQSFDKAMTTLRTINNTRDLDIEAKLINFKIEKNSQAKFGLNQIPSSIGRRGSASSEQNNSSSIAHLNHGNKKDHTFFANARTFMNKTLQRQRMHTNLTNDMLFFSMSKDEC